MGGLAITPLEFAAQVRASRPDAVHYYTKGGCWEFFALARRQFPSAVPLYATNPGHVAVQVGDLLFDVTGQLDPANPDGSPFLHHPTNWWKEAQPHRWRARMKLIE